MSTSPCEVALMGRHAEGSRPSGCGATNKVSPRIDGHQHFWDPAAAYDYPWLAGDFLPIRRRFGPADLRPSLERFAISGTVLVQTWNSIAETRSFLELASRVNHIAGVVGWVDLTDPSIGHLLTELKTGEHGRWLVGVRHLLHEEPDPQWLLRDDARRGLAAVANAGIAYDLVGTTSHLPAMLQTVADFPQLRFVLDHMAKPEIKAHVMEPWLSLMSKFGPRRDHVWCKLSGLVTEADWANWTPEDLRLYVAHALNIFGSHHCMFGSDWPVCLVAGTYDRVVEALEFCLADRPQQECEQIFGRSAIEAYRLPAFNEGGNVFVAAAAAHTASLRRIRHVGGYGVSRVRLHENR